MSDAVPFLCRLGWHDPDPRVRWNEGYYFTRCRRCGDDLIRTGYGRWQTPKGFRIVWSRERPASVETALIYPEEREEAAPAPISVPAAVPPPPPPPPVTFVPDFMDDPEADTSWEQHLPPPPPPLFVEDEPVAVVAAPSAEASRPAASGPAGERPPRRYAAFALAGFVLFALMVFALARTAGADASEPPSSLPPGPRFVSVDTSCRASPALDAPSLGYLIRGDAVQLSALEGDWAAIRYAGEQCWVPLTLLSAKPVT